MNNTEKGRGVDCEEKCQRCARGDGVYEPILLHPAVQMASLCRVGIDKPVLMLSLPPHSLQIRPPSRCILIMIMQPTHQDDSRHVISSLVNRYPAHRNGTPAGARGHLHTPPMMHRFSHHDVLLSLVKMRQVATVVESFNLDGSVAS